MIWAEDAETKEILSFCIRLVSKRKTGKFPGVEATFEFLDNVNDFTFYTLHKKKKVKIPRGKFAEAGISADIISHFRRVLIDYGGIGIGRDFTFEHIGGNYTTDTIIAHNISKIIQCRPESYQVPTQKLNNYFKKLEKTKKEYKEREKKKNEDINDETKRLIEEKFSGKNKEKVSEFIDRFRIPEVKGIIFSIFLRAKEANKLEKAFEVLEQIFEEHWKYQHPDIRANMQYTDNEMKVQEAYKLIGIKLPFKKMPVKKIPQSKRSSVEELRRFFAKEDIFTPVEAVDIPSSPVGTKIIAKTKSGNVYILELIDPNEQHFHIVQRDRRPDFPENGDLGVQQIDLIKREYCLEGIDFHSSQIVEVLELKSK